MNRIDSSQFASSTIDSPRRDAPRSESLAQELGSANGLNSPTNNPGALASEPDPEPDLVPQKLQGSDNTASGQWLNALLGKVLRSRFKHIVNGFEEGYLIVEWPDGTITELGTPLSSGTAKQCNERVSEIHMASRFAPHLESGPRSVIGDRREPVRVTMHNFDPIRRMALDGSIGWAESYMDGNWSTNDIFGLFMLFLRNEKHFPAAVDGSLIAKLGNAVKHRWNKNTLRGSRKNIERHYDLGNDFYQLWLDESMSYSSAIYSSDQESLEAAQLDKIDKILEAMEPRPGARILEIGCGWGAVANTLVSQRDVSVLGISLSREQLGYAAQRYLPNHPDSLDFQYCDYREVEGKFDHIVSIEMFEAVGKEYWSSYFSKMSEVLNAGGTAVLQIITIAEERYEDYVRQPDFIQKYIFPGGMLPTKTQLHELAHEHGFEISMTEFFGSSYAKTLEEWRCRFESVIQPVKDQGFDERFVRMWRYYLAYCEAGFTVASTDVGLWKFRKI